MREYECVEVKHHKDVGKTIAEYQKNGLLGGRSVLSLGYGDD
jgi:hypothetical protein